MWEVGNQFGNKWDRTGLRENNGLDEGGDLVSKGKARTQPKLGRVWVIGKERDVPGK